MTKTAAKGFTMMNKRMTEDEVKKLYLQCQTPAHVIAHCRAVADVAVRIGAALNQKGCHFDLALLKGAGMVHDVAERRKIMAGLLQIFCRSLATGMRQILSAITCIIRWYLIWTS